MTDASQLFKRAILESALVKSNAGSNLASSAIQSAEAASFLS